GSTGPQVPRITRRRTRRFRLTATPHPSTGCGVSVRQRRCVLLVAVLVRTASAGAYYGPYDAVPAQPRHQADEVHATEHRAHARHAITHSRTRPSPATPHSDSARSWPRSPAAPAPRPDPRDLLP